MYKIIGGDGREYGPISAEQLRQWITEGRANAQTQVLPEGATSWQPLGSLPEFAVFVGAGTGGVPPVSAPSVALVDIAALEASEYQADIGGCVSRGWESLKANFGLLLGGILLYGLIVFGIAIVSAIPFIGILGSIAQLILTGPLNGGLYWLGLNVVRKQPAEVSDIFAGFKRSFGNLILAHLVPALIAAACVIPGAIMLGIGIALTLAAKHGSGHVPPAIGIGLACVGGLVLLPGICVMMYLSICWMFTIPLVVDKGISFWDAMKLSRAQVRKHWWSVFAFSLVVGLLGLSGILACGVGLIVTGILAFLAIVWLYEDIFGSRAA